MRERVMRGNWMGPKGAGQSRIALAKRGAVGSISGRVCIRGLALLALLPFLSLPSLPLFSQGSQEGSEERAGGIGAFYRPQQRLYQEAEERLRHGTAYQKIEAARLLGAYRQERYLRPLIQELLEHLDEPLWRKSAISDPYVKSWVAWAIGRIGHPYALDALFEALAKSHAIAQEEIKAAQERKAYYDQLAAASGAAQQVEYTLLEPDRPGPFIKGGYRFPYGADQNYSVSDELKHITVDLGEERHRLRLVGANYTNLLRTIFISIGRIGDDAATERLLAYLDPAQYPLAVTRSSAAASLGDIGSTAALEGLNARLAAERDPEARLQIAYAILRIDRAATAAYNLLAESLEGESPRLRLVSARAFEQLAMAEALDRLKAAYRIENQPAIRSALRDAIRRASASQFVLPSGYSPGS